MFYARAVLVFWVEVAKPSQRRSPEAAIPKGFVGSNPTLRTNSPIACGRF